MLEVGADKPVHLPHRQLQHGLVLARFQGKRCGQQVQNVAPLGWRRHWQLQLRKDAAGPDQGRQTLDNGL